MILEQQMTALMLVLATGIQAPTAAQRGQPPYTLSVTKEGTTFVSLTAQDAKLPDIAADLARRLNAKVIVAPSLKDNKVTVQIAGTPLEPAMLSLAPRVYIDYELRKDAQPRPLGIYLLDLGDAEPAVSAVVQGMSQGLFVSGNTEDTGQPPKDAPLRITYDKGRLAVFAKEQPLMAVVLSIAEELGVPAEVKHETREVISTDIKDSNPEDALVGLSENVRVYVRANANGLERRLLRVVLVGPAAQ